MTANGPAELLAPLTKNSFLTRVTASVRLGRGVVGNTTFGLWASSLLALGLGVTFIVCGYPLYALYGLGFCFVWYLTYQGITWVGVARSPDAGVTADEDYLGVVATRQGAKNHALIAQEIPVIGGTEASFENLDVSPETEGDDA